MLLPGLPSSREGDITTLLRPKKWLYSISYAEHQFKGNVAEYPNKLSLHAVLCTNQELIVVKLPNITANITAIESRKTAIGPAGGPLKIIGTHSR